MNRTDRLLAIVLELQSAGNRRAADLAATFETSVRTIYRDMEALSEAGVPVVAMPGRGYALMDGYFLPPLSFTADEATMLLLGADTMAKHFDAQYRAAAETAGRKITGVLTNRLREEVAYVREHVRFVALDTPDATTDERLHQLRRAVVSRMRVRFRYHGRELTERDADPYGLVHVGGTWTLVAYDHLRGAVRNFRLDRIEHLVLQAQTFARPHGFSLLIRPDDPRPVEIVVRFAPAVARRVREARYFFAVMYDDQPDGLQVTLRARDERDVLHWLLSWGRDAVVIAPESLRRLLADETEAMLRNLHEPPLRS